MSGATFAVWIFDGRAPEVLGRPATRAAALAMWRPMKHAVLVAPDGVLEVKPGGDPKRVEAIRAAIANPPAPPAPRFVAAAPAPPVDPQAPAATPPEPPAAPEPTPAAPATSRPTRGPSRRPPRPTPATATATVPEPAPAAAPASDARVRVYRAHGFARIEPFPSLGAALAVEGERLHWQQRALDAEQESARLRGERDETSTLLALALHEGLLAAEEARDLARRWEAEWDREVTAMGRQRRAVEDERDRLARGLAALRDPAPMTLASLDEAMVVRVATTAARLAVGAAADDVRLRVLAMSKGGVEGLYAWVRAHEAAERRAR